MTTKPNNRCKIVATLGNIEGRPEIIEKLFVAGASVFRMNLSHDTVEEHAKKINIIRQIEKKYNRQLGVMFDLQGPKLRVGTFVNDSVTLTEGQTFTLDNNPAPGDDTRVNLPHQAIFEAIKKDEILLFNDGLIRVRVQNVTKDAITTTVLNGGVLSNRKGVNVPGVILPLSALTEKDRANISAAQNLDVDFFALSFVQTPQDVELAKSLIPLYEA